MSGLKPKYPSIENQRPRDAHCLTTSNVPVLCVQFESARQQVAIPYALLLRVDLSLDETACDVEFGTHCVRLRGRGLRDAFDAISSGHAIRIRRGDFHGVSVEGALLGPLIMSVEIEPLDEDSRRRG